MHDVMHCAQHCNQHVGDVWMMTMFAICGRALVVLAAAAVVAYKSLLAKSATTETTSLVLMPCSTEHSGEAQQLLLQPSGNRPAHLFRGPSTPNYLLSLLDR